MERVWGDKVRGFTREGGDKRWGGWDQEPEGEQ